MQNSGKKIKVVHVPWTDANPYQTLLAKGLEKKGVTIKREKYRYLLFPKFINITLINILVKHWKPDIIHVHWQHGFFLEADGRLKSIIKSMCSLCQMAIIRLIGIKVVWTAHNLKRHESVYPDVEKFFTRIFALLCSAIIAHCESAKLKVEKTYYLGHTSKIGIVPHGSYLKYYQNEVPKDMARTVLKIPNGHFTFLILGEIRPYKGVEEAIRIFNACNFNKAILVIAGKPNSSGYLKKLKRMRRGNENIIIKPNFIPNNDIQFFMNATDVVVFPYKDIFTSGGILLAMSFGKPVIASSMGCVKDLLEGTQNFLYEPRNNERLEHVMNAAIQQEKNLSHIGNDNLVMAKELSWDHISALTINIYNANMI